MIDVVCNSKLSDPQITIDALYNVRPIPLIPEAQADLLLLISIHWSGVEYPLPISMYPSEMPAVPA